MSEGDHRSEQPTARTLDDALQALETSLETPFVPGELERWTRAVDEAVNRLRCPLRRLEDKHRKQFASIEDEDPELMKRVEGLRSEDEEIRRNSRRLTEQVADLRTRVAQAEPDEASLNEHVSHLVDAGLAFVIQVRKQEVALRTWMFEAFNRDRGEVD